MKLLQIGPYPPPLGGWSFHIKIFQEYLDSLKIENRVLDIGENRKIKKPGCVDVQNGFDYLLKVFSHGIKRYQLYIHFNGNSLIGILLTLTAQFIALLTFRRSLLSFHAGVIQKCFAREINLHRLLTFFSFRLAKGIICNSEAVKEQIIKLGVKSAKVYPIPCFSMQYIKHEKVLTEEEQAFLKDHSPIFGSYIFFRDEYDPQTLFDALAIAKENYPEFGAVIIGSVDGAEPYFKQIKQNDLESHILFAGDKSHDNFLTIVENCDLIIRTPVSDGVCSSVMEALALKIPVVGSDNKTRPEQLVLFEPGNARDLVEKICYTLSNHDEIKNNLSGVFTRDAIQEELDFLRQFTYPGKA